MLELKRSLFSAQDRSVSREMAGPWREYRSVFKCGKLPRGVIKDNALVVVHPGFSNYSFNPYSINLEEISGREARYVAYLRTVLNGVSSAVRNNRSALVYTPEARLPETIELLGGTAGIIFVPTVGTSAIVSPTLLGVNNAAFYRELSMVLNRIWICGEYSSVCISAVSNFMRNVGIRVEQVRGGIFPPE